MAEEETCGDIHINIHKGKTGYGIYFQLKDCGIVVTKTDANSEAEKAGVQPGERNRHSLQSQKST